MVERTLDWVSRHDPRSRDYPVRAVIRGRPYHRNRTWSHGPILDQRAEGACVGHGWVADAVATPVRVNLARVKANIPRDPQAFAFETYYQARRIDEWAGESYDGTSVLAGAKAMVGYGLLREYRWAFTIDDVVDSIIAKGPVVLGIPWLSGMYSAPGGVLTPTGQVVGGHCLTAVGYRVAASARTGTDSIILVNSWGKGWGINGLAEISVENLARLLADQGEACVPVRRSFGR